MNELGRNVRFAFRTLSRTPGPIVAAVLSLANGIGANTALFSVVNGLLLKPLPYPDPGRLGLIFGHGLVLIVGGVVLGLAGALALTRVMRTLLFEVSPSDPMTFAGVRLLLSIVALAASYIPARRATRIEPLVALRDE